MAPQLGEIQTIAASVKTTPPSADILICLPATLIAQAVQIAAGRIRHWRRGLQRGSFGRGDRDIGAEMLKGAGAAAIVEAHVSAQLSSLSPSRLQPGGAGGEFNAAMEIANG
jgi:triosephosphate isomerase